MSAVQAEESHCNLNNESVLKAFTKPSQSMVRVEAYNHLRKRKTKTIKIQASMVEVLWTIGLPDF